MSALLHETLVDFLRLKPARTLELLARLLSPVIPRGLSFERARLRPFEGFAGVEPDVAIEIDSGQPFSGLLVLVEVQLRRDPEACLRWQAQYAHALCTVQRPMVFVVLAPDGQVAAWARREIAYRSDAWFRGNVLGPDRLLPSPRRNAPAEVELAILRGLMLGNVPALAGALLAMSDLPADLRKRCLMCMADRYLEEAPCPSGRDA